MTSAQAGMVLQQIRRRSGAPRESATPDAQLLERFATRRDEAAFTALVQRHGPMVLNVCRSVLRHQQDAEDAFQATFLVLARKASSIRRREAVAAWLYEVAHHVAARAQADAARRRKREAKAPPTPSADATFDMTLRDLHCLLHKELKALPDKYRLPLVLCYLEGRSHEESARVLGWSRSTFRGRLDRGREHLRRRLKARGIALSAILCAFAVAPRIVAAGQLNSVLRVVTTVDSSRASTLAEGVIRAMFTSKLKVATGIVLTAGLIVAVAALTQQGAAGRDPATKPPAAGADKQVTVAKPIAAENADAMTYRGRVLGPDGKPVAGAKLYLTGFGGYLRKVSPASESATSGSDGRFEFTISRAKFDDRWGVKFVAVAPKYGPGWISVRPGGTRDDLTIRLVEDDVPITGQIVDLEGKPIPNVTLTVWQINAGPGEDIGPWITAAMGKKGQMHDLEHKYLPRYTTALSPKVTTGADGRFRLTGMGRDRVVRVQLEGPTIATQHLCILTRPGKPIEVVDHKADPEYGEPTRFTIYYGADFRIAAAPCQPIVGVIRDVDTKKPLAGAKVRGHTQLIRPGAYRGLDVEVHATTDTEGRYRLLGMPTGKGFSVAVVPGQNLPYVPRHVDVPEGTGVKDVTVDIDLKRGVWIEGKITDKRTGKPLKGSVEYFSMYSNPNLPEYPGFDGTFLMGELWSSADTDGSFRIVGLPGPGLIGVYYQQDSYLRANEREDEFAAKEKSLSTAPYHLMFTSNYNAIARVDPAKGIESIKCDVTIDPGWTFQATVLGPDGKPLVGTRAFNLNMDRRWHGPMKSGEFTGGWNPRRSYDIVVVHAEQKLVGTAKPPKQNGGSVAVQLAPGAAATGRLVDSAGNPRPGVVLEVSFRPKDRLTGWHVYGPNPITTDRDGRFQIEALVPGFAFRLSDEMGNVEFGDDLRPGETTRLGDVRLKKSEE